jgi:hypothetical protein
MESNSTNINRSAEAVWEITDFGPITINQFKVSKTRITVCIMAHILDPRWHLVSFLVSRLCRSSGGS